MGTRMSVVGRSLAACVMAVAAVLGGGVTAAHGDDGFATFNVVGFGDSYASGEGAVPFIDPDDPCHRSTLAWIRHAPMPNGREAQDNNFRHAACAGATAASIVSNSDQGRGQLDALNEDTDFVLFSLGGNDAYFAPILQACIRDMSCLDKPLNAYGRELLSGPLRDSEPAHIQTVVRAQLVAALTAMSDKAPRARFIWAGYPEILVGAFGCGTLDGATRTAVGQWGRDIESVQQSVADEMRRTRNMDIEFVSTKAQFGLHGACDDGTAWINNFLLGVNMHLSFHPNALGQKAYVEAVRGATSKPGRTYGTEHDVHGAIFEAHERRGSWQADGLPTSNEYCDLPERDGRPGCGQRFDRGTMFWSVPTGAHFANGLILARYAGLGYERSAELGYPISDEYCGLVHDGCGQRFEHATMFWSPSSDAHWARGAILEAYGSTGYETGVLGYPVSDEYCGLPSDGCGQRFEHGIMFWSPDTGARWSTGAILEKYGSMGYERGNLGYPVSDHQCGLSGDGCFEHFQSGSIYWSPVTGAQAVYGRIRDFYADQGWERGSLGYPKTDERPCQNGRLQEFQGGAVFWTLEGGATITYEADC